MFQKLALIAISSAVALTYIGCSKKTDDASTSPQTYAGPGSSYTMTYAGSSFVVTKAASYGAATDWTASGSYTTSLGFRVLTVASTTGTGGPTDGSKAYALEVPGIGTFLKPMGAANTIIPMVKAGACPTGDFTGNWIVVRRGAGDDPSSATSRLAGNFSFTFSTGANSIIPGYDLVGYTPSNSGTAGSATCADGHLVFGGGADGYVTQAGAAIINASGEHIVAFPKTSFTLADLAGDYSALVFNESNSNDVSPASITISGSSGSAYGLTGTDIDAGTVPASASVTFTISSPNTPATGFFTSTVTSGSNHGNMICTVLNGANGTSQKVILCDGQDPADHTKLFNVLMVSR